MTEKQSSTLEIIIWLILFFPVGLYKMWKSDWHLSIKIAISLVITVSIINSATVSFEAAQQRFEAVQKKVDEQHSGAE
jgi:hypothetical protein